MKMMLYTTLLIDGFTCENKLSYCALNLRVNYVDLVWKLCIQDSFIPFRHAFLNTHFSMYMLPLLTPHMYIYDCRCSVVEVHCVVCWDVGC